MRIALLNPPWYDPKQPELWGVRAGSRWPHFQKRTAPGRLPRYVPFPFFLGIAASVCRRDGHDVLLLDAVAENLLLDEFDHRVDAFGPELVFAETSTPSLPWDLHVIRELRRRLPLAKFACGGTHPAELASELVARGDGPHYWLAGEYDLAVAALAAAIEGHRPWDAVPGLVAPDRPLAGPAQIADVNALPAPLFDQLPMHSYGDPVCGLPRPGAQTWLSRGCPFQCTFCVWPQIVYGNSKHRKRHIPAALDEVQLLIDRHGCESFYFDDDTTNIGQGRMIELAGEIRRRGLDRYPWSMMARADCMRPAMIEALAAAGLYSIKYGVESISPPLLDACEKNTNLARMKDAIRRTKELGVKVHLTFTFGLPGETPATIAETMDFALETVPDTAQFSICTPFPGTKFYRQCQENGWLVTEDWGRFLGSGEPVIETPSLSAAELKRGFEWACATWDRFCADRLESRRANLLGKLNDEVAAGRSWQLLGDRDFAQFLFDRGGRAISTAYVQKPADDHPSVTVVVSRHDEEKHVRRLAREGPATAGCLLRLYG